MFKRGVCVQCWTNGGVKLGEMFAPGLCYSSVGIVAKVEKKKKAEGGKGQLERLIDVETANVLWERESKGIERI